MLACWCLPLSQSTSVAKYSFKEQLVWLLSLNRASMIKSLQRGTSILSVSHILLTFYLMLQLTDPQKRNRSKFKAKSQIHIRLKSIISQSSTYMNISQRGKRKTQKKSNLHQNGCPLECIIFWGFPPLQKSKNHDALFKSSKMFLI